MRASEKESWAYAAIPCPVGKLHMPYFGFLLVEDRAIHQNQRRGITLTRSCNN